MALLRMHHLPLLTRRNKAVIPWTNMNQKVIKEKQRDEEEEEKEQKINERKRKYD